MSVRTAFSLATAAASIAVGETDAGARAFTAGDVFVLARAAIAEVVGFNAAAPK